MKRLLLSMALLSLTSLVFAQEKTDYSTVPALVKEAQEKGNTSLADSLAEDYINNYLFTLKKEELYTKENLIFIGNFIGNENSRAFKLFMQDPEGINAVLGAYQAQVKIMFFINKKYLPKGDYKEIKKPDWDALEKMVVNKFGTLGKEITWGQRMIYYWAIGDWKNYGIWYQKYFNIGLKHPFYHINNLSWAMFEHVEDPKLLKFACDVVMKYAIEEWLNNDGASIDTYANLLHKTRRTQKAIEWEEKAVVMMKGAYNEKEYTDTLEKMKKGLPTWPENVK